MRFTTACATYTTLAFFCLANIGVAQSAETREDVLASAPHDIGPRALGRLFTSAFEPIAGEGAALSVGVDSLLVHRRSATERQWRVMSSTNELRANARVWGINAGASQHQRHAIYRAIQIDSIHEIDPTFAVRDVAPGAEWYVSAVYVGRLVEYHFASATRSLETTFSTPLPTGASVRAFASQANMTFAARTIGLEATTDDALFASDAAGLAANYAATGDAQPIMVRYSRVPRSGRAVAITSRARRIQLVSVEFPLRKPNNSPWDILRGAPDIQVRVFQNGRLLAERQGSRNSHVAQLGNYNIGELTLTSAAPLTFEFVDLDPSQNEAAGQLTVDTLPEHETAQFRLPPNDVGVTLVLAVGP